MNDVHSRHSRIGHWNKLSSDLSIDHFRMCETQLRLFKCNYFPRLEREAQHQLQLRPVHKTFVNLYKVISIILAVPIDCFDYYLRTSHTH